MSARSLRIGKMIALVGISLVVVGIAYFFFDEATTDWYGSTLLDIFGMAGVLGAPIAFIGIIVWAKQLGKQARLQMAATVFFAPWLLLFLGYLTDGLNVHGSAGLVMLVMILAATLAIVILLMAAAANNK